MAKFPLNLNLNPTVDFIKPAYLNRLGSRRSSQHEQRKSRFKADQCSGENSAKKG